MATKGVRRISPKVLRWCYTRRFATTIFSPTHALQHCCDIVSNSDNIVPTLQRCIRWCYTGQFATMIFSPAHCVATLLRHCFESLQHCSNIATLCWAKSRRCESSRATSPLSRSSRTGFRMDGRLFSVPWRNRKLDLLFSLIRKLDFLFCSFLQACRVINDRPQELNSNVNLVNSDRFCPFIF